MDGIKNKAVAEEKVSYVLRSANPEVPESSAEFQRTAAYVKNALSAKGYYEAPPGAAADMVVEVDSAMEAPKTKTITYREMTCTLELGRNTPESVAISSGTFTIPVIEKSAGAAVRGGPMKTETITTYPKHLRITARATSEDSDENPAREVWSVYVTNEDRNGNFQEYEPLLVAAAMDKVNEDTSGEVRVVLKPEDDRVKFVKSDS